MDGTGVGDEHRSVSRDVCDATVEHNGADVEQSGTHINCSDLQVDTSGARVESSGARVETSADLMKYRLPYLETELTAGSQDALLSHTSNMQNNMIARMKLGSSNKTTPRSSRPSTIRSDTTQRSHSTSVNMETALPQTILDSLSCGVKTPMIQNYTHDSKLPTLHNVQPNLGEKSFQLKGVGLGRSQSMRETSSFNGIHSPVQQRSSPNRKTRSLSFYSKSLPRTPLTGNSRSSGHVSHVAQYIQLQQEQSQREIRKQARSVLENCGIANESVLQRDITRVGRGLFFPAQNRMNQSEKRLDSIGARGIGHAAEKHIYMCQIPSLMTRASVAGVHVRNLRARLTPRSRGTRQLEGRFLDNSHRNESPRRRQLVLVSGDRMMVPDSRRSMYRSNENLYQSTERLNLCGGQLDIRGAPITIIATKERVL